MKDNKNREENKTSKQARKFLRQVEEMREDDAYESKQLGWIHKYFVKGAFPHSEPEDEDFYSSFNGQYALWVEAKSTLNLETGERVKFGVPFGALPRLIAVWICTEIKRTKSPKIQLGKNMSDFFSQIDVEMAGGENGRIRRVSDQLLRFCYANIGYREFPSEDNPEPGSYNYSFTNYENIWQDGIPKNSELFGKTIHISKDFYCKVIDGAIPVDFRAIKALKASPLALDLYMWLTYRVSYLEGYTELSWKQVMEQLGAEYKHINRFGQKCRKFLKRIKAFWPELNYKTPHGRLRIEESEPHIKKKK